MKKEKLLRFRQNAHYNQSPEAAVLRHFFRPLDSFKLKTQEELKLQHAIAVAISDAKIKERAYNRAKFNLFYEDPTAEDLSFIIQELACNPQR